MNTVAIGGQTVPAIGMGSWHLGQGRHSDSEEEAALRMGITQGLKVIDTAEMYGGGRSEQLIGRAIAGQRDKVYLVSKIYPWHATDNAAIGQACADSLQRLKTDHLDLYLLHWRADANLQTVVSGFEQLRGAGKIRAWGVSNFDVDDMQDLFAIDNGNHCATNQVLYNLGNRNIEFALQPWCLQHNIPIMAYSPLGSGNPLLRQAALAQVASKHQTAPAAIALAWVIRNGHTLAIPESGEPAHVQENSRVLSLTLDADDLAALDRAFAPPTDRQPLSML